MTYRTPSQQQERPDGGKAVHTGCAAHRSSSETPLLGRLRHHKRGRDLQALATAAVAPLRRALCSQSNRHWLQEDLLQDNNCNYLLEAIISISFNQLVSLGLVL